LTLCTRERGGYDTSTYIMKKTKARIIYEYSKVQGWDSFMWGDGSILDVLFEVAGLKAQRLHNAYDDHPIDKWAAVLNVCEKNSKTQRPLFKKFHVDLRGMQGIPHGYVRGFSLL
jgi:hypothetical protein